MLYRLSYSLARNRTGAPGAGNTPAVRSFRAGGLRSPIGRLTLLVAVVAPGSARPQDPAPVVVHAGRDGTVLLSGSVATIRGTTLRWEPEEHKRTLGYWTRAEDAAEWRFSIDGPGAFDVEVLQGCGPGQGGSDMVVTLDAGGAALHTIRFVVEDTGGFQQFRARTIGRVVLSAGEHALRVQPERIARHAACDIRQIRLLPAVP